MKTLVVTEHTRIHRCQPGGESALAGQAYLHPKHFDRLRRFDKLGREERDRIFDWGDGLTRSTQWVGVVQTGDLQIEILPKIDTSVAGDDYTVECRRSLLYMLAIGGDIPVRSRDIARLAQRRAPLSEILAGIFAKRLKEELLKGPERAYITQRENMRSFKGRLLTARQVQHNSAHRERFYCEFDEFSDDTMMNRIFRATCRILQQVARTPATLDALQQCILLLDGVSDVDIQDADFGKIVLNRQNERFDDVLRFCRLLLAGRTPTIQSGDTRTFSLLFDMNRVFERFIAAFLQQYVVPRLPNVHLFTQASGRQRYLMQCGGVGVLRLKPDLLFEAAGSGISLVMDTKWKLLAPTERGRGGVGEADLYQLYAYTRRYGSSWSVLLYPHTPGLVPRDFAVLDDNGVLTGEVVAVRQVGLHRDLFAAAEREKLALELEALLREGLRLPAAQSQEQVEDVA